MVGRDEVGLPSLPVTPAATSAGSTTLAGSACADSEQYEWACPAITSTEQRKAAGSIPAPAILIKAVQLTRTILIGRSPWRPTIARDAGGRWSVAASPRPADVRVKPSGCPGHPPVTNVACNCVPSVRTGGVGIHPQSNAGVVENVQLVLPGVRLVVRVRCVGGGDPPSSEYQPSGLAIAKGGTLRHQVATAFATQ